MVVADGGRGAAKDVKQCKIVVTGPFGAGKTTLIGTLSEVPVLSTEREVSVEAGDGRDGQPASNGKSRTTVAMDFGRLTIDPELVLYLFGTPGQRRFDFMWRILSKGMLGFVLVVDAGRQDTHEEAGRMLRRFREFADVPFVVGLNKHEGADTQRVRSRLALPRGVPCLPFDARDKESVKSLLLALLYAVLEEVEAAERAAV